MHTYVYIRQCICLVSASVWILSSSLEHMKLTQLLSATASHPSTSPPEASNRSDALSTEQGVGGTKCLPVMGREYRQVKARGAEMSSTHGQADELQMVFSRGKRRSDNFLLLC